MKKVYLLLSAFFVAGTASAQVMMKKAPENIALPTERTTTILASGDRAPGDEIYGNDFSTPSEWTTDPDANGNEWTIETTTPTNVSDYMGDMASTTNANGFGCYDGISDLLGASVTVSTAYIELNPTFSTTGIDYVTLEFEQRYRAFNSDDVFVEVSNDGTSWTQYQINASEPTNGPAVQSTERINISAVAGNQATVYVRFYWEELTGDGDYGAGYGWMVDDLSVFESWEYDQGNLGTWARAGVGSIYAGGLDYGNWSIDQVSAIEFSGMTENLGSQIQTGAKLNVDITGDGTFSTTSPTTDLAIEATDSLVGSDTYTPSAIGTYDITYWFDGTNAEEVTDNDSSYWTFYVNELQFGRDDATVTGGISAVSSSPDGVLTIGNVMEIFADGEIGSLVVGLTSAADNVDQLMYGECWKWDDGLGEYVFIAITEDHTITAGENGGLVTLNFDETIDVVAGDELLITAGHYGGSIKPQFAMSQAVQEGTVLGYSDGSLFQLTSPNAIVVRANMFSDIGTDELEETAFNIGQNMPNPFDNNSVINYTLNEATNVSFKVVDMTGKVVMSENYGNVAAGDYKVSLSGSDFSEGTYMYTFTIGDKQVTKRMVVTK